MLRCATCRKEVACFGGPAMEYGENGLIVHVCPRNDVLYEQSSAERERVHDAALADDAARKLANANANKSRAEATIAARELPNGRERTEKQTRNVLHAEALAEDALRATANAEDAFHRSRIALHADALADDARYAAKTRGAFWLASERDAALAEDAARDRENWPRLMPIVTRMPQTVYMALSLDDAQMRKEIGNIHIGSYNARGVLVQMDASAASCIRSDVLSRTGAGWDQPASWQRACRAYLPKLDADIARGEPRDLDELASKAQAEGKCQLCGKRPPVTDDYACAVCVKRITRSDV